MAGIDKLIAKMKNQPNGISPKEADKVLTAHGYTMLRQRGSHRSYRSDTKDYLKLPYHIVIQYITDESGSYYFATVKEFDGCMSHGSTHTEAFENIQEAMELWIEGKIKGGFPVPLPIEENHYSGKFVLRIPKTLHAHLAMEAEKEGVSLNQYALYRLSV
jgi:predicted RNase H-like HicB family nuclease